MPENNQAQLPAILLDVGSNEVFRGDVAKALPKHSIEAVRYLQVVYNVIYKNQDLQRCSLNSLHAAIMTIAHLGLNPEPSIGQIYIIPRGGQATVQTGYRGLITLARRINSVASIQAKVVYAGDSFELEYGTEQKLSHIPTFDMSKRGSVIGAYSLLMQSNGINSFDFMPFDDIEKIRQRSKSRKGPWFTDYEAMCCKTVLKRHLKFESLGLDDTIGTASAIGGADIDHDIDFNAPVNITPQHIAPQQIENNELPSHMVATQ